jgi:hypothetical protein
VSRSLSHFNDFICFHFLEIKDTLFHPEIIICAIATAVIYASQLLRSMANLRQHIEYYSGYRPIVLAATKDLNVEEARAKATKYPGYLIRFTVGGYVITFHILLFVAIIPRLIWQNCYALRYIPNFLLLVVLLYVLQYVIIQIISKLMRNRNRRQPQGNNNGQQSSSQSNSTRCCTWCPRLGVRGKSIIQYFILVASKFLLSVDVSSRNDVQMTMSIVDCFISVTATIWRLLLIFLINTVSINRVEFSTFADPFTALGESWIDYTFNIDSKEDNISFHFCFR